MTEQRIDVVITIVRAEFQALALGALSLKSQSFDKLDGGRVGRADLGFQSVDGGKAESGVYRRGNSPPGVSSALIRRREPVTDFGFIVAVIGVVKANGAQQRVVLKDPVGETVLPETVQVQNVEADIGYGRGAVKPGHESAQGGPVGVGQHKKLTGVPRHQWAQDEVAVREDATHKIGGLFLLAQLK